MFTIITNIDASFLLYLPPATTKTETALRISIERISCVKLFLSFLPGVV